MVAAAAAVIVRGMGGGGGTSICSVLKGGGWGGGWNEEWCEKRERKGSPLPGSDVQVTPPLTGCPQKAETEGGPSSPSAAAAFC